MDVNLLETALMAYLKSKDTRYYSKVLELRDAVRGWLAYIPHSFPHYTRHTIEHSDQIILQVSSLLFPDDPEQPAVTLSPVESYILAAAAYLHDAGMVVSDKEKLEIIGSDDWKSWTSGDQGGAKRWHEIQSLRHSQEPADEMIRNFLADIQTRFLIAEFIRRSHHLRAVGIITQHQAALGRFAFDDPILLRTISDVCVAHGLQQDELQDRERYPDRRDIQGQRVNVRFLAILLRLGDLLDMSFDRACPLLLNAACPLPAQSLAHWTQYQCITHRLTAPDKVELTAECHTQDEHRFLQDWCQWLINEIRYAEATMVHSVRHRDWTPPKATLEGTNPTIMIRPASDAIYKPLNWKFELDHEAIFHLLVNDIYGDPSTFIRELIQNALDANRCQMYIDIQKEGTEPPEFPTQFNSGYRNRYPVRISLKARETQNQLSGEKEKQYMLTVEDCGIGMDNDIIQRYFLQVGRSYYTTEQFKRTFRFVPTSRFGLGFLSVFAVSDHVTVETYKPSSLYLDGPIRLILTGPRNYLLIEQGNRQVAGTRIDVLLREPMAKGELTKLVTQWCRYVEVPIVVDDLGDETIIVAESAAQFTCEMPDITTEGAKFIVRAFPINRQGIEGSLYVFGKIDERGENWATWDWARYTYPRTHPQATIPNFPDDLICLHGITLREGSFSSHPRCARLDYRKNVNHLILSRRSSQDFRVKDINKDREIESRWQEILEEHLATSNRANSTDAWIYKQRLIGYFPSFSFWALVPETIQLYINGQPCLLSLKEVLPMKVVTVTMKVKSREDRLRTHIGEKHKTRQIVLANDNNEPTLTEDDLLKLSKAHRHAIFANRKASHLRWLTQEYIALDWSLCQEESIWYKSLVGPEMGLIMLTETLPIGFEVHKTISDTYGFILLNRSNSFIQWLIRIKDACELNQYGLQIEQFNKLMGLFKSPVAYYGLELSKLISYLEGWSRIPNLPLEFYPSEIELTSDMFVLKHT